MGDVKTEVGETGCERTTAVGQPALSLTAYIYRIPLGSDSHVVARLVPALRVHQRPRRQARHGARGRSHADAADECRICAACLLCHFRFKPVLSLLYSHLRYSHLISLHTSADHACDDADDQTKCAFYRRHNDYIDGDEHRLQGVRIFTLVYLSFGAEP